MTIWQNSKGNDHYYTTLTSGEPVVITVEEIMGMIYVEIFNGNTSSTMSNKMGNLEIEVVNRTEILIELEIHDFIVKRVNQGYGTVLMRILLDYLYSLKCEQIRLSGYLAEIDEQDDTNFARRNHIYEKFGFCFKDRKIEKQLYTNKGHSHI
ncbi:MULTISPECIES: GNAT family N-acetyltransferase [Leuconostoc]|uniref:GNAT family N-acetyltransferase n=1 Tax=Leuconostoc TaxID=1243 RepID=UPI00117BCE11|nr:MULTISPECIES: GNAT family N-acetyltransferase [Leuconostoc]MBZ5947825.1 hypothetical protein [Leuconostoc gasicomitatum]MBZ5955687.1 hypothetical protein [Leuconostoc gasicomitatum]MBZ5979925.1 hypothetical protein [Leuconostoc gasicomitatum]MBZ5983301.1 hypothetical protein [Leuconostoc gasicomitatum]MBZ5995980.1 hypothetical protein [Leuconostoc gasicomitatum]